MGEIADYHVDMYSSGAWGMPSPKLRKLHRCSCVDCRKEIACESGLMRHRKAKHGDRYTETQISNVWDRERYL